MDGPYFSTSLRSLSQRSWAQLELGAHERKDDGVFSVCALS